MHMTAALRKAAQSLAEQKNGPRSIRSLALSVYFRQPDFGMKNYEILSRATAFLLAVDPPEPTVKQGPYSHLEQSEAARNARRLKQDYAYEPAGGPSRPVEQLGWLEFCPSNCRPVVHCVASSHVLAPWLWKNYYPQDWLSQVTSEHCAYSLEVFDSERPDEALAKFALNPYPIHDPSGRDLAMIHLTQEETALKHLKDLGVKVHHLRNEDNQYSKGEEVYFDGFVVAEQNSTDQETLNLTKQDESLEDTRVFYPYSETGSLIFSSQDRFLASTPTPLPEGLCGGPTLDEDGRVCGIVEGVVPVGHEDKRMAGAASFLPSFIIAQFVDFAEQYMLEKIVPKKLFDKVVQMKSGKALSPEKPEYSVPGSASKNSEIDTAYDELVKNMKSSVNVAEAEAILNTVQRERDEVINIWQREGGDVDEIVKRVRRKTRETQDKLLKEDAEKAQKLSKTDKV